VTITISNKLNISTLTFLFARLSRFDGNQFWQVLTDPDHPHHRYPATFSIWAVQNSRDRIFLAIWRGFTQLCRLHNQLLSDILFQRLPFFSSITHLGKESSFEPIKGGID